MESIEKMVDELKAANTAYRNGNPVMSDAEYDHKIESLRKIAPDHEWLDNVEPEPEGFGDGRIAHKQPMLSTEKAYSHEEMEAFFKRVNAAAEEIGIHKETIEYRITPKLDGLAGYRNPAPGVGLATRGNGLQGEDISRALERLQVIGNDVDGPGEIVMPEDFFLSELETEGFRSSRNFMVGLIGADTIKPHHQKVMDKKMGHFVAYKNLNGKVIPEKELMKNLDEINKEIRDGCEYATDGIVIEVINKNIKEKMGSTNHHHRWQIAYKTHGETALTTVRGIVWQTGRTGRVTPVIEIEPVDLSGATISRATAHTAKMIERRGIGVGATVKIIRAGEVIPKIEEVIHPVAVNLPEKCPCCGSMLAEDGEYLTCENMDCEAQASGRIIHFFKTLGTADGFGPKAADKLVSAGITSPLSVLKMCNEGFESAGFGNGESSNLVKEIRRCLSTKVEDWRFLAAFGIRHLGRGDSRKLLKAIGGMDGLETLTTEIIMEVEGFAEKTARSISTELSLVQLEIEAVIAMGIPLESSKQMTEESSITSPENALSGLSLVFTGTFSVPRGELEDDATRAGAHVQSSVNKKTTALVAGDKVGAVKTEKARSLGVAVWTEADYRAKRGNV